MTRFLESLLTRFREYFDLDRLGLLLGEILINVIIAATVLAVFYLLWRMLNWIVSHRLERRLDKTSAAFVKTTIKFSMFGIAVVAALGAAGVRTAALLGSLGVAGLTIGFALRDTLSNIISGILVFMDRPFTIDDLVEIDGKYGREHVKKRLELRERVFKALTAAGVEMPFETIQLAPHRVTVEMPNSKNDARDANDTSG